MSYATLVSTVVEEKPLKHVLKIEIDQKYSYWVELIAEWEDPIGERVPFTYELKQATSSRVFPFLNIVAAPGVEIVERGFPVDSKKWGRLINEGKVPFVQVARVQSSSVVPEQGSGVSHSTYFWNQETVDRSNPLTTPLRPLGKKVYKEFEKTVNPRLNLHSPNDYLIAHRPDGVDIYHSWTHSMTRVRVPVAWREDKKNRIKLRESSKSRFSVVLNEKGGSTWSEKRNSFVSLIAFGDVDIVTEYLSHKGVYWTVFKEKPLVVYRCKSMRGVPQTVKELQTANIELVLPKEIDNSKRSIWLEKLILDVSIGVVPVVGDLVDISEFFYGVTTGRDKWGDPIKSNLQLALMGLLAVLPFVTAGAAKVLLKNRNAKMLDYGEQLKRGALSSEELKRAEVLGRLAKIGKPLNAIETKESINLISKLKKHKPIETIINESGTGFVDPRIQVKYLEYLGRKPGKKANGPMGWANITQGGPLKLLRETLGMSFRNPKLRVRNRSESGYVMTNVDTIAVPKKYTASDLEKDAGLAIRNIEKLMDGTGRTISAGKGGFLALKSEVPRHLYWKIKGNLAEILSRQQQLKVLNEYQKKFPDADIVLYTGVRVKRLVDGKYQGKKQFSDNIIAARAKGDKKGNIQILGVMEVKSGPYSSKKIHEQVFDWIELRAEDGLQLIIENNSRIYSGNGKFKLAPKEEIYTYKPKVESKAGEVVGLVKGDRHMFIPKGLKYEDVGSLSTSARQSEQHLPWSTDRINYVAAQLAAMAD